MIYINQIGERSFWVTSDDDAIGLEISFDRGVDENEMPMIALAEFLGYDPHEVLAFESLDGVSWKVKK